MEIESDDILALEKLLKAHSDARCLNKNHQDFFAAVKNLPRTHGQDLGGNENEISLLNKNADQFFLENQKNIQSPNIQKNVEYENDNQKNVEYENFAQNFEQSPDFQNHNPKNIQSESFAQKLENSPENQKTFHSENFAQTLGNSPDNQKTIRYENFAKSYALSNFAKKGHNPETIQANEPTSTKNIINLVKSALSDLQEKTKQISKLKAVVEGLNTMLNQKESEIFKINQKYRLNQQLVNELKAVIKTSKNEAKRLSLKIETDKQLMKDFQTMKSELERSNTKIQKDLLSLKEENEAFASFLSEKNSEIDNLKKEIKKLNQEISKANDLSLFKDEQINMLNDSLNKQNHCLISKTNELAKANDKKLREKAQYYEKLYKNVAKHNEYLNHELNKLIDAQMGRVQRVKFIDNFTLEEIEPQKRAETDFLKNSGSFSRGQNKNEKINDKKDAIQVNHQNVENKNCPQGNNGKDQHSTANYNQFNDKDCPQGNNGKDRQCDDIRLTANYDKLKDKDYNSTANYDKLKEKNYNSTANYDKLKDKDSLRRNSTKIYNLTENYNVLKDKDLSGRKEDENNLSNDDLSVDAENKKTIKSSKSLRMRTPKSMIDYSVTLNQKKRHSFDDRNSRKTFNNSKAADEDMFIRKYSKSFTIPNSASRRKNLNIIDKNYPKEEYKYLNGNAHNQNTESSDSEKHDELSNKKSKKHTLTAKSKNEIITEKDNKKFTTKHKIRDYKNHSDSNIDFPIEKKEPRSFHKTRDAKNHSDSNIDYHTEKKGPRSFPKISHKNDTSTKFKAEKTKTCFSDTTTEILNSFYEKNKKQPKETSTEDNEAFFTQPENEKTFLENFNAFSLKNERKTKKAQKDLSDDQIKEDCLKNKQEIQQLKEDLKNLQEMALIKKEKNYDTKYREQDIQKIGNQIPEIQYTSRFQRQSQNNNPVIGYNNPNIPQMGIQTDTHFKNQTDNILPNQDYNLPRNRGIQTDTHFKNQTDNILRNQDYNLPRNFGIQTDTHFKNQTDNILRNQDYNLQGNYLLRNQDHYFKEGDLLRNSNHNYQGGNQMAYRGLNPTHMAYNQPPVRQNTEINPIAYNDRAISQNQKIPDPLRLNPITYNDPVVSQNHKILDPLRLNPITYNDPAVSQNHKILDPLRFYDVNQNPDYISSNNPNPFLRIPTNNFQTFDVNIPSQNQNLLNQIYSKPSNAAFIDGSKNTHLNHTQSTKHQMNYPIIAHHGINLENKENLNQKFFSPIEIQNHNKDLESSKIPNYMNNDPENPYQHDILPNKNFHFFETKNNSTNGNFTLHDKNKNPQDFETMKDFNNQKDKEDTIYHSAIELRKSMDFDEKKDTFTKNYQKDTGVLFTFSNILGFKKSQQEEKPKKIHPHKEELSLMDGHKVQYDEEEYKQARNILQDQNKFIPLLERETDQAVNHKEFIPISENQGDQIVENHKEFITLPENQYKEEKITTVPIISSKRNGTEKTGVLKNDKTNQESNKKRPYTRSGRTNPKTQQKPFFDTKFIPHIDDITFNIDQNNNTNNLKAPVYNLKQNVPLDKGIDIYDITSTADESTSSSLREMIQKTEALKTKFSNLESKLAELNINNSDSKNTLEEETIIATDTIDIKNDPDVF